MHSQVAIETLFGAILGIIGAALLGPPLKQISWASEMRQQYDLFPNMIHQLTYDSQ